MSTRLLGGGVPGSVPTVVTVYYSPAGPMAVPTCYEWHPLPEAGTGRSPEVLEQVLFCFGFSLMTKGRS